ncbi:MAG: imidazole glycerol phosphate synthase subunit HisH [Magnetococcales bacterium]|nr:imidazole glycerol phosphate synthase subunit HisH [Magnetococcales bacterium]
MVVIVDYGCGNPASIANMAKKIGQRAVISADPEILANATRLILPGVGSFDQGMGNLRQRGLRPLLDRKVLEERVPILGICLGAQLLCRRSGEGREPGLGWIDADVVRFDPQRLGPELRIPHMGWSDLTVTAPDPLFAGLDSGARFYFVHSYHLVCDRVETVIGTAVHGHPFTAAVARDTIRGVQFHPEKSHRFGMTLLDNFFRIPPGEATPCGAYASFPS